MSFHLGTVVLGLQSASKFHSLKTNFDPVEQFWRLIHFLLLAAGFLAAAPLAAQTVTASVATGLSPQVAAVNPVTNKIYVANYLGADHVTVIDGATNTTTTVAAGVKRRAIAVNTATNKIYVANEGSNDVTVIDGATNTTVTVAVGNTPYDLALNPVTNKIYVVNQLGASVTVIDGATLATTTVAVGSQPQALAVNPVTNKIYVANSVSDTVSVIDGVTNAVSTVPLPANAFPQAVAVNPVTNRIYVAKGGGGVTVINGADNTTAQVTAGANCWSLAVNPVSNKIYVANADGHVTVIDGATNGTTTVLTTAGSFTRAVAVNPVSNRIYVAISGIASNDAVVIDGATNATVSFTLGGGPIAAGVNPLTNKAYFVKSSGGITVMDGATNAGTTLPAGTTTWKVAVNRVTNKIYATNYGTGTVTVIDGTNNTTATVTAGSNPIGLDVNPITNKIYVANYNSSTVTVINGADNSTSTVTLTDVGRPYGVAVNPLTNKIYVTRFLGSLVTVIDGATQVPTNIAAGNSPYAIAINQATNKIYATNRNGSSVTVINGASNATTTVPTGGFPTAIAVNPATNKIYVVNDGSASVTVIDGATNGTTSWGVGSQPKDVAVNPVTNKVYVANGGNLWAFDGATGSPTTIATVNAYAVAVNPATNKIYVANNFTNYTQVIDGITNTAAVVATGNGSQGIAVNPVTGRAYVANYNGNSVSVVVEQQVSAIPLTTAITPLPGNQTLNPTPTFTFTATSGYSPTAPPVRNVYFQIDTWQGRWLAASPSGPNWTGASAPLQLGSHILYAFATDGQEATSINTGSQSSPIPGQMTAYLFMVLPPLPVITTPSLPDGESGLAYNQTLTAASGSGSGYTWSVVSGLPAGMTLSTGGVLGGTPAAAGPVNLTVQVMDGFGGTASRLYSFTIITGLAITTASLPDGEVSLGYSQTLAASGGSGGNVWSVVSGLPGGLALSGAGVLTGTPVAAGPANLTVQVSDSLGYSTSRLFTFTIYSALAITTPSLPNFSTGVPYSQSLAASGGSGGNVWSPVTGFPAWLSLSPGGALSGTPTSSGSLDIIVRVTDSLGKAVDRAYSSLRIVTSALPDGELTLAYNQTLVAADGSGTGYTWAALSGLPAGLAFSTAGVLSGTPTATGPATLTVQVTDSASNTVSRAFNFTIHPALAITTPSLPNGEVNLAYGQSLSSSGGSGGNVWSVVFGLPPGLSLSAAGVLSGTPTAAGSANLSVRVTDSLGGTATQSYTFSIFAAITVTTATLSNGSVGIPYTRTISASGGSGGNQWTITSGLTPSGIAFSPTGTLSGTPQIAGTSSFTVQVQDSLGAVASRPLSLTIIQPLAIMNSNLTDGVFSEPYPFTVLQAAGGVTPYLFSVIGGSLPPGLSMNPSGQITGLPTQVGSFPVTFRVTDFNNSIASRGYTLIVVDPPAEPNWTPRGQFGGKIQDVRVSPDYANDQNLLVMSETGELFRSADKGGSWSRALVNANRAYNFNNRFRLSPVFSAAPTATSDDQKTVFFASFDIGVWKSIDRAATFTPANNGIPCAGVPCTPGVYPQIIGLAISPNYAADHTLWAADYENKIYRTTDGGANWSQLATLPPAAGGLNTPITPSPSFAQDQTLFLSVGNLIFKSLNAGSSWSQIYAVLDGLGQPLGVKNLVISPAYAVDHTLIAEAENFHLFRTKNRGTNFNDISLPGAAYGHHLTVVPRAGLSPLWYMESSSSGNYVYRLLYSEDTGTTFARLYAFGMSSGNDASHVLGLSPWLGSNVDLYYGTDLGLYASFNGGFNFAERDQGLNANVVHSVSGRGDVVAAAYKGGWFKSADKAANRVRLNAPQSAIDVKEVFLSAVSPDYANDNIIFLGDSQSVLRSADGGQSFAEVLSAPGNETKIAFLPAFSGNGPVRTMYLGNAGGLYQSTDGGQSFTAIPLPAPLCSSVANAAIQGIVISPNYATDQTIFVASAISGTEGGLCKSVNGGASWTRVTNGGTLISGPIAISPSYNEAAGPGPDKTLMIHQLRSVNGGATWTQSSGPANLNGVSILAPNFAANQTAFMYGDGIFRSTDFGATFSALSAGDALQSRNVTGLYIPPDFNPVTGEVAASTNGSGVWRSADGGRTFQPTVGSTSIPGTINSIVRVPGGAGLQGRGVIKDLPPEGVEAVNIGSLLVATAEQGIFQSDDGGVTFTNISAGLPPNANTKAVTVPSNSVSTPVTAVAGRGLWKYNGASWDQISGLTSGIYTSFTEDNLYLYATRSDGVSMRADKSGNNWTPFDPGQSNLVAMSYNPAAGPTSVGKSSTAPAAVSAALWSVSQSGGPRYSLDNGASWIAANGVGDYQLPAGLTYKTVQALGINAVSGGRDLLVGTATRLYRSTDGGEKWRDVSGPGSGLESTSQNFSTTLASPTANNTIDTLVGAVGATTGGVYLSGDGGEHWSQINEGFDPNNLNISTLVKTSCSGCPVQYYSGTYGSGVYTRTIAVNAPPAFPPVTGGWCFGSTTCTCGSAAGSGPEQGGQPFRLCGTNFLALPTVEFDGVPASGCAVSGSTVITCTGTPPHIPGTAAIRVRNTDTRVGVIPTLYTYIPGSPRSSNLTVAKSGLNAALAWSCPDAACTAALPARVYRSQNPLFTLNPENYSGGPSSGGTGGFSNAGALAPGTFGSYFWRVE